MRLLILTQAVDEKDQYLGFFTGWIRALSRRFEHVEVVCLKYGTFDAPENVAVHSLGKESGVGRFTYVARFYRYIWTLRGNYDAVFVHMNQEYVLLGALIWRLMGKRVYLWRNHYAGGIWTRIAVALADGVFCTSKYSYTARFAKTRIMPVGADIASFVPSEQSHTDGSILFFGRMAPSKRPHVFVRALEELRTATSSWSASIVGSALPQDEGYAADVRAAADRYGFHGVTFKQGISHREAPALFAAHDIYVNLGSTGMYDKTLFEASASGCLVLAASDDFAEHVGEQFHVRADDAADVAAKLAKLLAMSNEEKRRVRDALRRFADENSLERLADKLHAAIV